MMLRRPQNDPKKNDRVEGAYNAPPNPPAVQSRFTRKRLADARLKNSIFNNKTDLIKSGCKYPLASLVFVLARNDAIGEFHML